jgi:hypothetical protein
MLMAILSGFIGHPSFPRKRDSGIVHLRRSLLKEPGCRRVAARRLDREYRPIPTDETDTEKPQMRADCGRAAGLASACLCRSRWPGGAIINLKENPDEHS